MSIRTSSALRNLGRISYALPMAGFGALSFVLGDLTTRFARGWPEAAAAPGDPLEWSGVFESLATSGIALMLAGCTPGRSDPRPPTLSA